MTTRFVQQAVLLSIVTLLTASPGFAQMKSKLPPAKSPALTTDPNVRIGKLPNGITYYIRKNQEPKNRAELRLAVNAGSVLETDAQQGLAHFVEHMAFNGTKNFRKQELVNFLEKSGVNFGADLNAYTSFDETVYELQVPTDSPHIFKKAMQILEDWAHNVSFENEEIDKERGVIVEEWRLGRGAQARLRDQYFPVILAGSRYANRIPIGTKENLDSFRYETLKQFYKDWYRPDLQAVIVVGDVDINKTEQMIRSHFGKIPARKNAPARTRFGIPDHLDTKVAILTDKEQPYTVAQVYYKQPAVPENKTEADYRASLVRSLFNQMMSARLYELAQKPDAPFSFGGTSYGKFLGDKDAFSLFAVSKDGASLGTAISALLTENERVKKFGFTAGELDRARKNLFSTIENAYNERNKTESAAYAEEYIRNYLSGEAIPGIEKEFALHKKYLSGITLSEVNALITQWIRETDRAVVITAPEKEKDNLPKAADITAMLNRSASGNLAAYDDKTTNEPLIATLPKAGSITAEKSIPTIGATEWTLSNGMRVVLKPTDFKNDEIRISGNSPGGTSLYGDDQYYHAANATQLVAAGGIGNFDVVALQKMMAGKQTFVAPYISGFNEGIFCNTTPREAEMALQLIYLYFTAPRKDTAAITSLKKRAFTFFSNKSLDPNSVFSDSVSYIMGNYSPRRKPVTVESLNEWDIDKSMQIYRERFANAADFTFTIVGNFKPAELRPMVERYLASLPATGNREVWKDDGVYYPQGEVNKVIRKGTEPKSAVRLFFTGTATYSAAEQSLLTQTLKALEIKLREKLREEASGVYGVSLTGGIARRPRQQYSISIAFGCAPENVEKLISICWEEINKIKKDGALPTDIEKVMAEETRSLETRLKQNDYWQTNLQDKYFNNEDPALITEEASLIRLISVAETKRIANQYFNEKNRVRLVLMPE